MKSNLIKLSSRIRIRKEHFGGILFNMDTGDVIEIDREAFMVISIIRDSEVANLNNLLALPLFHKGRRINRERIQSVLSKLTAMGVIKMMPNGVLSEDNIKLVMERSTIKIKWPAYQYLSAPGNGPLGSDLSM